MTPRLAAMYALDEVASRSWDHDYLMAPTTPMLGRELLLKVNSAISRARQPCELRQVAFDGAFAARTALRLRRKCALETMRRDPGKREEEIAVTEYYAMWCAKAWARCMELAASCA